MNFDARRKESRGTNATRISGTVSSRRWRWTCVPARFPRKDRVSAARGRCAKRPGKRNGLSAGSKPSAARRRTNLGSADLGHSPMKPFTRTWRREEDPPRRGPAVEAIQAATSEGA